jgi:hypothetical protein
MLRILKRDYWSLTQHGPWWAIACVATGFATAKLGLHGLGIATAAFGLLVPGLICTALSPWVPKPTA